jgi:hypothetical protein
VRGSRSRDLGRVIHNSEAYRARRKVVTRLAWPLMVYMKFCLLDLASLHFEHTAGGDVVVARTPGGEIISRVDVEPGTDNRRAAAAACDAALAGGTLLRSVGGRDQEVQIALYNPYSSEVALGGLPETKNYGDGDPVILPNQGALAHLEDGFLHVGDRRLPVVALSSASCSRALSAHPDPR